MQLFERALKLNFCAEEQMRKHALMCEDAIVKNDANKMVDHTTAIARLANRVLQVAKQEADNSEDPVFISDINRAADQVQTGEHRKFSLKINEHFEFSKRVSCSTMPAVAPMVQDAKAVALDPRDAVAASNWRESNKKVCI